MRKTDIFENAVNDFQIAMSLLTRLPLPEPNWPADNVPAKAAWAYPLAGAVVAIVAGLVACCLVELAVPAGFAAGVALFICVITTGAMHEDGLADCADGFGGGWTRERRMEIMKDSNIGTYGVSAMVLTFGLRWSALTALFAHGWVFIPLLVAAITSRAGMVWAMACLPNARTGGLSSTTGRPTFGIAGIASLWAIVICGIGFGPSGAILLMSPLIACAIWGLIAVRKIGGQTGDVLGATQQICEVVLLGAMAAMI